MVEGNEQSFTELTYDTKITSPDYLAVCTFWYFYIYAYTIPMLSWYEAYFEYSFENNPAKESWIVYIYQTSDSPPGELK